ncbi:hypothetical protein [Aliifodinibius sp. S!AR15-10]|nr:hypothetical protein [Aliifodinibius sp. S!AR15-10]
MAYIHWPSRKCSGQALRRGNFLAGLIAKGRFLMHLVGYTLEMLF